MIRHQENDVQIGLINIKLPQRTNISQYLVNIITQNISQTLTLYLKNPMHRAVTLEYDQDRNRQRALWSRHRNVQPLLRLPRNEALFH